MKSLQAAVGATALLAVFALGAPTASAQQVGYPPERSPYRDLEYHQELTLYSGYYAASQDPARVAPQSAPMLGARYDVRIGGPAYLTTRVARVFSERTLLDPTKVAGQRTIGTQSWPLYLADAGISVNLTGQKSLHHLVPVINGGAGIASDFKGADKGGFKLGTTFALTFGGGVRWVPGGRWQLRADVTDYLYQVRYPDAYFVRPATDQAAILAGDQAQNVWKHNAALTVGASYLFFR